MTWTVHHAEVLDALAGMPSNSVDGCFCDPPYGLGSHQPAAAELIAYLGGAQLDTGGDFMGRDWHVPSVRVWSEIYRVLKPGGHVLAFAGPRTVDLISIGMRAAGFAIRDVLTFAWVFGSGFPKSQDASIAIDKRRNDTSYVRVVCRFVRRAMVARELTSSAIGDMFGVHSRMVDHWAARDTDSQPTLPTWDQWLKLKTILSLDNEMDAEVWRLNGRKGDPGEAWQTADIIGEHAALNSGLPLAAMGARDGLIRAPSSDLARTYDGHGTALKPAFEPITLARKPLDGTLAENIARWGTGTIAIDACRIGGESTKRINTAEMGYHGGNVETSNETGSNIGRWPANLILNDEAGAALDAVVGNRPSTLTGRAQSGAQHANPGSNGGASWFGGGDSSVYADDGGPSRFFWSAKVSREERDLGCGSLPMVSAADMTDSAEDAARLDSPRTGAGRTSGARNSHPTLKPVSLCRYLARLVLPPAGRAQGPRRVLVPYAGSGSEMVGCLLAGWDDVVGIEREPRNAESPDYVAILKARVGLAESNPRAFDAETVRGSKPDERQLGMFGKVGA